MVKKNLPWILPLLAVLILAPFTPGIDLAISHYFYDKETGFSTHPFFIFLYKYGPILAQIVSYLAGIAFILSFISNKFKTWRRPAACLVLTMAIGAGLIVHAVLKDNWGRPRPKQSTEFGGNQSFRPFYHPNIFDQPEPSKSFSCGHCSMGFYFFALALVGKRLHNKALYISSFLFAIILGILLSLTRIAQGGHFFSDTLITAVIMWLTAYAIDRWIYSPRMQRFF